MRKQLAIRLDDITLVDLKKTIKIEFKESVQEFVEKAIILRLKTKESPVMVDPIQQAILDLRAKPAARLSAAAIEAVRQTRIAVADGSFTGVDVDEAISRLSAEDQALLAFKEPAAAS